MRSKMVTMALLAVLCACGDGGPDDPDDKPVPSKDEPQKPAENTVVGQVVDERGQPVADALISIWPAMFNGYVETRTDAQGHYRSVELNAKTAPYYAQAYKAVSYAGRRYCVRLAPESPNGLEAFNPAEGVVLNWRWRLTGDSGDPPDVIGGEYWGGSLKFGNRVNAEPGSPEWVEPEQRIEFTLVPNGPLIDGSTGVTLTGVSKLQDELVDIPVGRYTVTAVALGEDGSRTPLKVSLDYLEEAPGSSADLLFEGFDDCGHTGTFIKTALWLSR
jgi:predicted small lipoprotein YifL